MNFTLNHHKILTLLPSPRQNSGLMVLRYLVGQLGRNAWVVFQLVSQMAVPQSILFLLLRESGLYQMTVQEVTGRGGAGSEMTCSVVYYIR